MSASVSSEQTADQAPEASRSLFARLRQRGTAWRVWAGEHRWKALGLGGSAFALLVLSLLAGPLISQYFASAPGLTLDTVLVHLDAGQYEQAIDLAQRLFGREDKLPGERSGPLFVLGAATAAQAESMWSPRDKRRRYLLAARYLEESRDRGFPEGRRQQGLFLLGSCLHESKQFSRALSPLKEALAAGASQKSEIHRLLSQACLSQPRPDARQALQWNDKYLADRGLPPDELARGRLLRARILRVMGNTESCRQVLLTIPPRAEVQAEALTIRGQLALDKGDKVLREGVVEEGGRADVSAAAAYQDAIRLLRQAEGRDTSRGEVSRQSAYLIGVAFRRLGDNEAAREQFSRVAKLYAEEPAGLAANLELAELLAELGKADEAAAAFRHTLRRAGGPDRFHNPWIPIDHFRERILLGYQHFLESGEFPLAIDLTRDWTPLIERPKSTQLRAEAYRVWADQLAEQAKQSPAEEADELRTEARSRHRQAGQTYALLARLNLSRRYYPDNIWSSAESYLQGHDYTNAERMFRQYLANDAGRHRARALVGLGEALLALGKPEEAVESLQECIELHPKDPASYRARLLGSSAYLEMNEAARARKLLLANLHHESLTPRSMEWRDSLFALGKIHYSQARSQATNSLEYPFEATDPESKKQLHEILDKANKGFEQAIHRLEEFVARYTDAPQIMEARYMMANAHWQSARLPQLRLASTTIDATRVKLHKQIQQSLGASVTAFGELQEMLNRRQDAGQLSVLEQALMRNSYFAQGGVLFDLAKVEDDPALFEQAIEKYSSATNRYQHGPASLEAFVQIADCYRRLGRLPEARGTIEQARVILKRMPQDAAFEETTRYGREEWISLLDWLASI